MFAKPCWEPRNSQCPIFKYSIYSWNAARWKKKLEFKVTRRITDDCSSRSQSKKPKLIHTYTQAHIQKFQNLDASHEIVQEIQISRLRRRAGARFDHWSKCLLTHTCKSSYSTVTTLVFEIDFPTFKMGWKRGQTHRKHIVL